MKRLPINVELELDDLGELAEELNEKVLDILSNEYGFCVESLGLKIKAVDIEWDKGE